MAVLSAEHFTLPLRQGYSTQPWCEDFRKPPTYPWNPWIFFSTPIMQGSAITMICLDKATSSSPLQQPFHILRLHPSWSATSRYFHLPPHYENHMITIHVSLNKVNSSAINISTPDFHIWQHFSSNWTTTHIQKLADIPEIQDIQLYKHMIGQCEPIVPFEINRDWGRTLSYMEALSTPRDLLRD